MKVFSKKNIVIGVLSAAFALCAIGGLGALSAQPSDVLAQGIITSQEILPFYAYGQEFTVPDGKIVYGDAQIDAQSIYVKFPDGTMKKGDAHVLSAVGEYTVVYVATYQGKTVTAEQTFAVNEQAYVVSSDASSIEYVYDLKTTETENDSGLKVTLVDGDAFQYNQLLDVSHSTQQTPLIKIYPYSYSILADNVFVESYYTIVRLTDYYDPNNYVEISMGFYLANAALGRYHPYVVAGASNQTKSGVDAYSGTSTARRIVYIDDVRHRVYYGTNDYGTMMDPTPDTPVNGVSINNFDNYGMSVYYEAATNRIYVKSKTMHLITDLDDAAIYDNNLFAGFTTGEVVLSVYGNEYQTDTATYEIAEIDGVKGAELKNFELLDRIAPVISLSSDANDFYVAKGEEFTLFTATAKDKHLIGDVQTYVYYEYGSSYQTSVFVKDGKFTPNRTGEYTIVYVAKDAFGNVAERKVTCNCVSLAENRLVHFATQPVSSVRAGETTVLNEYVLSGVNDGLYLRIYAVFAGDEENRIAIDAQTRAFFPRNVGTYTIVFEYGDIVQNYTYSYPVDVSASENVYMETPLLPSYLIKDAAYSLEKVYAETYAASGPVAVTPQIFVKEDGKGYSATPIQANNYVVKATNNVRFCYVYNGETLFESDPIAVVDVGFAGTLHLEKYFVGDVQTVATADYVRATAATKAGDATMDFINAISFSQFACNFAVPKEAASLAAVELILTDYYDCDNTLTIRYEATGSGTAFSVNGGAPLVGGAAFAGTTHQIWYDEAAKTFVDASGNTYEVENPFRSDKMYLSFRLCGLSGDAALDVYKIGSQFINADGYDWVNATVYVRDAISGIIDCGQTLTFQPAEITDVLTPYVEGAYAFYVLGPGDQYVTSDANVLLDGTQALDVAHTITFDGYGMYRVVYEYRDQFGNPSENVIVLYVNDRIAPTIVLEKGYGNGTIVNGKIGETIKVVGYTVDDNFGADSVSVAIRALSPDNEMIVLQDMSFTANVKGEWKVLYYAADAEGNYSVAYYTIKVA